jgi:hypothetical protein
MVLFMKSVCMKVMVPDGLKMARSLLDSWSRIVQRASREGGNTRTRRPACCRVVLLQHLYMHCLCQVKNFLTAAAMSSIFVLVFFFKKKTLVY